MVFNGCKPLGVLAMTILSVGLGSFSTPSYAQYQTNTDDVALLFCSYIQTNDSTSFRNTLREQRLRLRDIYPRIRCNNYSMIQFATVSGSHEIGRFIAHSVLVEDMQSVGDINWIQQLEATDPIAEVVRQRYQEAQYLD